LLLSLLVFLFGCVPGWTFQTPLLVFTPTAEGSVCFIFSCWYWRL